MPYREAIPPFIDKRARLRGPVILIDHALARDESMRRILRSALDSNGEDAAEVDNHIERGDLVLADGHDHCDVRLLVGDVPSTERPAHAERVVRDLVLRVPSGRVLIGSRPSFGRTLRDATIPLSVDIEPGVYRVECWEDGLPANRGSWLLAFGRWREEYGTLPTIVFFGGVLGEFAAIAAKNPLLFLSVLVLQLCCALIFAAVAAHYFVVGMKSRRAPSRIVLLLRPEFEQQVTYET